MTRPAPKPARSAREANPVETARRNRFRRRLWSVFGVVGLVCGAGTCHGVVMPGASHSGPLPPLTGEQSALADALRRDVTVLAQDIGERNVATPRAYARAADAVAAAFRTAGFTAVERRTFVVSGVPCDNLIATLPGSGAASEIVVLGAHYDSADGCPGADDNATGVAGVLAIARRLRAERPERTIRFVAFANEEPPYFHTSQMGSLVYAKECADAGDQVVAMVSLDGIGFYSDREGSQDYPFPFSLLYPSTANFIAFVGDFESSALVRRSAQSFREHAAFPSEGLAFPNVVPGIDWSDHWSFWQYGYPAIEVTDTLPFRYRHYHRATDRVDQLDFESMARVVQGLGALVLDLANDVE